MEENADECTIDDLYQICCDYNAHINLICDPTHLRFRISAKTQDDEMTSVDVETSWKHGRPNLLRHLEERMYREFGLPKKEK
jgi:histidinol-phosphate/aromatic aminotransferase/cobyric acid decarboxylase-like protein